MPDPQVNLSLRNNRLAELAPLAALGTALRSLDVSLNQVHPSAPECTRVHRLAQLTLRVRRLLPRSSHPS